MLNGLAYYTPECYVACYVLSNTSQTKPVVSTAFLGPRNAWPASMYLVILQHCPPFSLHNYHIHMMVYHPTKKLLPTNAKNRLKLDGNEENLFL